MTVTTLCDAYHADAQAGRLLTRRGQSKQASTLAIDRGRIERHFKPLLGSAVVAVTRQDRLGYARRRRSQIRGPRQDKAARSGAGAPVAAARRPERWGCSARSSPMLCVAGCGRTIQFTA